MVPLVRIVDVGKLPEAVLIVTVKLRVGEPLFAKYRYTDVTVWPVAPTVKV